VILSPPTPGRPVPLIFDSGGRTPLRTVVIVGRGRFATNHLWVARRHIVRRKTERLPTAKNAGLSLTNIVLKFS